MPISRLMTEKQIQNGLYDWLLRKGTKLCCPNYTPAGWFECDLWAVTDAGYSTEFEIKLTKADFKKDGEKIERLNWRQRRDGVVAQTKHAKLEQSANAGPNRFYYVAPKGLLAPEDIPEWAGHIEVIEYRCRIWPTVLKQAPQLHKEKVPDKVKQHCMSVFYYRFWSLRQRIYPCKPSANKEDGTIL